MGQIQSLYYTPIMIFLFHVLFLCFSYKQHDRFHWGHPVSKPPIVLMSVRRAVRKTPVFDRRLRTHAHVRVRVPLNVGSRGILLISTIFIGGLELIPMSRSEMTSSETKLFLTTKPGC